MVPWNQRWSGWRDRRGVLATLAAVEQPDAGSSAIFVLPTTTDAQIGPVAGWISASGWAAAAERQMGSAWIVTRQGVLTVEQTRERAAGPGSSTGGARRVRGLIPTALKTLVKDAREAQRAAQFRIDAAGPWQGSAPVEFVWQRHELFHRAGLDLAEQLEVPSVLFVPALTVWQAERWAVRRPGWGGWLEQHAERPALTRADLVACGTDVIAEQAARLGVSEGRLIVTPTGADLALFAMASDRDSTRRSLGIDESSFVIGWVGSFRAFHAIDQLVRAAGRVSDVTLLLVGDGPQRSRVEQLVESVGVTARFTGTVAHGELPGLLRAMDVGAVMARPSEPFHYSPLKVAEYLAAGLPVVAPRVAQLADRLDEDVNALLFEPGSVADMARALAAMASDSALRSRLADGALRSSADWSWDRQIERVREALRNLPLRS